jgi:hypothetical protein
MAAQQMTLRRDRAITKTATPRLASSEETFLSFSRRTPSSSMTEPLPSESKSNFWSTGNSIHRPESAALEIYFIKGKHA